MTDLGTLTNLKLQRRLEEAEQACRAARDAVFALTIDRFNERWSQIVDRLGADHPKVIASRLADLRLSEVESECRRRLGPVNSVSFAAYLAKSPRYVRERTQ